MESPRQRELFDQFTFHDHLVNGILGGASGQLGEKGRGLRHVQPPKKKDENEQNGEGN